MATLEFEEASTGAILVHLTVYNNVWTKQKYKDWKDKWKDILQDSKTSGIDELFTLVDKHDEKLNKFQKMFGFQELLEFKDYILYRKEI